MLLHTRIIAITLNSDNSFFLDYSMADQIEMIKQVGLLQSLVIVTLLKQYVKCFR